MLHALDTPAWEAGARELLLKVAVLRLAYDQYLCTKSGAPDFSMHKNSALCHFGTITVLEFRPVWALGERRWGLCCQVAVLMCAVCKR